MSRWRDGLAELRARREVERALSDADWAAYVAEHGEPGFWGRDGGPGDDEEEAIRAVSDTLDALPYQGLIPRAIAWRRTEPAGFLGPDNDLDALWRHYR